MIPLSAVTSLAGIAAGFALAWQLQAHQIVKLELTHATTRIAAAAAARAAIERNTTALAAAQNNAAVRVGVLRRDADAARAEYDGLQSQSSASLRAAASSLAACTVTAATFSELFNQCGQRYTDMARDAQGHVSDVTTLTESWPK